VTVWTEEICLYNSGLVMGEANEAVASVSVLEMP